MLDTSSLQNQVSETAWLLHRWQGDGWELQPCRGEPEPRFGCPGQSLRGRGQHTVHWSEPTTGRPVSGQSCTNSPGETCLVCGAVRSPFLGTLSHRMADMRLEVQGQALGFVSCDSIRGAESSARLHPSLLLAARTQRWLWASPQAGLRGPVQEGPSAVPGPAPSMTDSQCRLSSEALCRPRLLSERPWTAACGAPRASAGLTAGPGPRDTGSSPFDAREEDIVCCGDTRVRPGCTAESCGNWKVPRQGPGQERGGQIGASLTSGCTQVTQESY